MKNKNALFLISIAGILGTTILLFQMDLAIAQSQTVDNTDILSSNMWDGIGDDTLVFTLEDWGGFIGIHSERTFSTYSGILTTVIGNTVSKDVLSPELIDKLRNEITKIDFFNLKDGYDPKAECCDITQSVLSITMGDWGSQTSKTTYWNAVSEDVPEKLKKLASTIRNIP